MRRMVCASVGLMLVGLAPVASVGAPAQVKTPTHSEPPIVLAQGPGWWEQENRYDDARQRYWQLHHRDVGRYNQLQGEINQLQRQREQIEARIQADLAEQHRILGY